MRAQILSVSPFGQALFHSFVFVVITGTYLLALFGLGESNLPEFLRIETDWFLFEEMSSSAIATFSGGVITAAAVLGFCYGFVSAVLYNLTSKLLGGGKGRIRHLD